MHYLKPQPIKSIQLRVASVGLSAIIISHLSSASQLAERLLSNTGGALSYRMYLQHQMDQGWYMFMQHYNMLASEARQQPVGMQNICSIVTYIILVARLCTNALVHV